MRKRIMKYRTKTFENINYPFKLFNNISWKKM